MITGETIVLTIQTFVSKVMSLLFNMLSRFVKIPWRRERLSTPVFWPGEFHGLYSHMYMYQSVQLLSHVQLFAIPWTAARRASLSITNSQSLLKLMSFELEMPNNHFILCCPLLLSPSIFPSIRVFSNESALRIRWPKYWSFSFSLNPSNEHSGLISFRMDWLDLFAVQGALKSLLQHHSSKASFLWAQLSSQSNSHIHT